jgi:chorismate-pyruvate lyase
MFELTTNNSQTIYLKVGREDVVVESLHATFEEVAEDERPLLHDPNVAVRRVRVLAVLIQ